MTTNISEYVNALLKGTRFLPSSVIVRAIYERLHTVVEETHCSLWRTLSRDKFGHTECLRDEALPIPNESMWPEWMGLRLRLSLQMKRKAKRRPVSTRIRNEMDMFEHPEKICGICKQYGHMRMGCRNAPTSEN
ncbi:hypothetical protein PIB30_004990 [Stylosanthes scabra]|uniref:Uncharacterized protein n=1 Tax=Stylosanthes scabra TaxID=79078 RepID=A0ABU6X5M7_9FABA|nr:hypothetical protein [Stylosanthes scabra]